ncbi:pullulanase-type alpha-1,6-glucosidase [Burkholderiaceae bacterium DAT-1]|nr:pullulanase-type alpha-1,6-glucosidase [Burkholderiaceae bacterium DAT-1]
MAVKWGAICVSLCVALPAFAANPAPVEAAQAIWLTPDTLVWPGLPVDATVALQVRDASGKQIADVPLAASAHELPRTLAARFPWLAAAHPLTLAKTDRATLDGWLRQHVQLVQNAAAGRQTTGVQLAPVLDTLYAQAAQRVTLGPALVKGRAQLAVWAPTAQSVELVTYTGPRGEGEHVQAMQRDAASGVWRTAGPRSWINRLYYRYRVTGYSFQAGSFITREATDPYSSGLSQNSERSLFVDLNSAATQPVRWTANRYLPSIKPTDISLYELHIRDFSISDASVPAAHRGKYLAFSNTHSDGMRHLTSLAQAGLTHIHLLPPADFSSVNEDPAHIDSPRIDPNWPGDGEQQQAEVMRVHDRDGFNWGYDPLHYATPEGSYATSADGLTRIREFRAMVADLHRSGLRVVTDMVFNHTADSGSDGRTPLDRIVPGYYYRLDADGRTTDSTCCANTATEHAMMARLMIDSLRAWAVHYGVDGFRFDLMGHQPLAAMQAAKAELRRSTGRDLYLYGEGWDFGEVEHDRRFVQARQANLAGTGIGSFSDRQRDAVRGGGYNDNGADIARHQGFANGQCATPHDGVPCTGEQLADALHAQDLIRLGLAGNLAGFQMRDAAGKVMRGDAFRYHDAPAAYAREPGETITYVSAHDNETLFDINQYKLPLNTSTADRARAQIVALATVAFSQGVPFFHAGDELLRSKSLDRNTFDAGDWFNRIDWRGEHNNWAVGLPPKADNGSNWPVMQPLLANPALQVSGADIRWTRETFKDLLRIRTSSPLFHLPDAAAITRRVSFPDVGPNQQPGVIVMRIDGRGLSGSPFAEALLMFNARADAATFVLANSERQPWRLHPAQVSGADAVVKTASFVAGQFTVPARTVAVWVR